MEYQKRITVGEGMKLAADRGFSLTRPTVLARFKASRSCVRVGSRFFMTESEFLSMLEREGRDAAK